MQRSAATLAPRSSDRRTAPLSWWDSLIVAAAQSQNCTILLSEDLEDGREYSGVTVRNPFEFRVSDIEAYRPMTRPVRRKGSAMPRA